MTIISVIQSSAEIPCSVTSPAIGLQYFLNRLQIVRLMSVHGALDYFCYLQESNRAVQKCLNCNLIGGVHYRRHALTIADGTVRQTEAAEFIQVRFEKGQP